MSYRTDKFKVGDRVVWDETRKEQFMVKCYGSGPFTLTAVFDRKFEPAHGEFPQSNWEGMGHTQHVVIDNRNLENDTMSGAWLVKI